MIQRLDDPIQPREEGMFLAGRIPGARLVELPGHRFWWKDDLAATIEAYFAQFRAEEEELNRVLASMVLPAPCGAH